MTDVARPRNRSEFSTEYQYITSEVDKVSHDELGGAPCMDRVSWRIYEALDVFL